MGTPLERAAASVFMIVLGYALKRAGFFSKGDADAVAKLCLNITLPAAIITGFGSYKQDFSLFAVIALGAVCNAVVIGVSWFLSVRSSRRDKIFHMFALPGLSDRDFHSAVYRRRARALRHSGYLYVRYGERAFRLRRDLRAGFGHAVAGRRRAADYEGVS